MNRLAYRAAALAMAFGICGTASAQPLGFVQYLEPPPASEQFSSIGFSIAAEGDLALVGGRTPAGATATDWVVDAYQFIGGEWVHIQTIDSPDPIGPIGVSNFGISIGIDQGVAVIGDHLAPRDNEFLGAVYAYRWDGSQWQFEQKLTPKTTTFLDTFGYWSGISNNTIVVAAPNYEISGGPVHAGLQSVFEYKSGRWELVQEIYEPDITGLFAGELLLFENDTIVFGSLAMQGGYTPHVLRRGIDGNFAFDEGFNAAIPVSPYGAHAFDIDGDEVLLINIPSSFDIVGQLSMLGFKQNGVTGEWSPSTIVTDPAPGFFEGTWAGAYIAKRRGDHVVMSMGPQRPLGSENEATWRVLAFQQNADGAWAVQNLEPPTGFTLSDWEVYQIHGTDNGQWFIAGGTDTGAVAVFAPITPQTCPADLNNDGIIDSGDLGILLGAFGTNCP